MKSILDLLKIEDNVVRSIERMEHDLSNYRHMREFASACDIDCASRNDDIRRYGDLVDATAKGIASAHVELIHIREQIRLTIMGN